MLIIWLLQMFARVTTTQLLLYVRKLYEFDGQSPNYRITNFPSNLISEKKILSEMSLRLPSGDSSFLWGSKIMSQIWNQSFILKSLSPEQNDRHMLYDIFQCVSFDKNYCSLIQLSLNFTPKGPIDNKSGLVMVLCYRWTNNFQSSICMCHYYRLKILWISIVFK